ncbi:glycoside hydrolase family 16 protein [Zobellia nedashkovskayae]|uniref:glycoside hydrolase family 16 protein n=1 Tax=Zobellia nedashkovskayae TaxID=2779510 RepID=UPI00188C70C6|nr:glycoside hydrolase family 16 protein [Zobellia nedashkovskayae]
MRFFLKYSVLLIILGSCSRDVSSIPLDKDEALVDNLSLIKLEGNEASAESTEEQASFVADFDSGTFMLNGKTVTKELLIDPYRIEPRGTNKGAQDNALLFPLSALGVTGNEWTYWIEVTFPDTVTWTDYNFFAESGTINRNNRIVHRITSDSSRRCISEFFGGNDVQYLGSERTDFSVGNGTRILIKTAIDASSIITKFGEDPAWEKEGILPNNFEHLAVGADLLGFQDFPDIKINRVVVFNEKLYNPNDLKPGYDVSAFTEEVFFDDFTSLSIRTGAPNNYQNGQGTWTPRFSYADNDESLKGWSDGRSSAFNADPAFSWPHNWSPFDIEDSTLKIRMNRSVGSEIISEVPINTATGQPYEWIGGVLTTKHSNTFRAPCYIEARIKFPSGKGLWNAFWLYNNYDGHKEIDIAEQWAADITNYGVGQHNLKDDDIIHENLVMNTGMDLTEDYHRYGVVWADGKLVFLLDGKEIHTMEQHNSLTDRSLYIILNTSIGGHQGNPDATALDKNEMLVDWVRVKNRP